MPFLKILQIYDFQDILQELVVGGPYQKLRLGTQVEDPVLAKRTPESCFFSVLLAKIYQGHF